MAPKTPSKSTHNATNTRRSSRVATMLSRAPQGPSEIEISQHPGESTEISTSQSTSFTPQDDEEGSGTASASQQQGTTKRIPIASTPES